MSSSIEDEYGEVSELERLLPLLPDADPEEAARLQGLLALASFEEQALAEAYEADELALKAFAKTQSGDHPILEGFADSVMAAIASEEEAPEEAPILRPDFSAPREAAPVSSAPAPVGLNPQWILALAALFLGGLGLAILFSSEERIAPNAPNKAPLATLEAPAEAPIAVGTEGTQPEKPSTAEELSSPKRPGVRVRAPKRRPGIVPVEGRSRRNAGVHRLFEALRGGLQPPSRVPPLKQGERELNF